MKGEEAGGVENLLGLDGLNQGIERDLFGANFFDNVLWNEADQPAGALSGELDADDLGAFLDDSHKKTACGFMGGALLVGAPKKSCEPRVRTFRHDPNFIARLRQSSRKLFDAPQMLGFRNIDFFSV